MSMLLPELVTLLAPVLDLVRLTDEVPDPEDVKAGWGALAIFALMGVTMATAAAPRVLTALGGYLVVRSPRARSPGCVEVTDGAKRTCFGARTGPG